jgi:hypothetical protein
MDDKYIGRGLDSSGSGRVLLFGSCEDDNSPLGSTGCEEFF